MGGDRYGREENSISVRRVIYEQEKQAIQTRRVSDTKTKIL